MVEGGGSDAGFGSGSEGGTGSVGDRSIERIDDSVHSGHGGQETCERRRKKSLQTWYPSHSH